jgi:protease-4
MRPYTQELFNKLNIKRVSLKRGERAGLYSDEAPLTPEEDAVLRQSVEETYRSFKQIVANGRNLPYEDLDPICEGRVWSGRQALTHNLVDANGDFVDAVQLAAKLANLPTEDAHEIPVVNIYPTGQRYMPPKPFDLAEPKPSVAAEIWRLFSGESLQEISGQPLTLMPFKITFR